MQPPFTMDMYCMQAVKNYMVEIFLRGLKYSLILWVLVVYIVADVEELGWSTFSVQSLSSNPYCCNNVLFWKHVLQCYVSQQMK